MRHQLSVAMLGFVCVACPNPNTFTVPRTVPAGEVQHSLSVEAIGVVGGGESAVAPTPPSYTARIGVADRFDVGLHLSHMTSLGADLKWNPVRSPGFDFAIDPGGQVFFIAASTGSVFIYYLHAPLLLGINASESTTIVLAPGISMVGASASTDSTFSGSSASDTAFMARAGIGIDIRTSKKFAIHPETTFLIPFEGTGVIFLAGVGFNFGAMPNYAE